MKCATCSGRVPPRAEWLDTSRGGVERATLFCSGLCRSIYVQAMDWEQGMGSDGANTR